MTPERKAWWNSLPKEEKRVRMDIELCKKQIKWQKRNLRWVVLTGDECKMIINHNKRVIKDLRKEIAQRPVMRTQPPTASPYKCPRCGASLMYLLRCVKCGQKLRWK